MSHDKRKYKVVQAGGGDLKDKPALADKNGNIIPKGTKIVFKKNSLKKVDHHRIRFEIPDFGRSALRFAPNMSDVMWANPGNVCPTSSSYMDDVFWVDKMDEDGGWVDVINMNLKRQDFYFTLNFVEKSNPGGRLIPLDPPGGNENGGGPGSGFMLSGYLATGLATGAIVGLGTAAFASEYFVEQNLLVYGIGGALVGLLVGILADRM